MYIVTQINDQIEGSELFTTFVLTDESGVMPEVRLEKHFIINDRLEQIIENQKKIDSLFYENQFLINGSTI